LAAKEAPFVPVDVKPLEEKVLQLTNLPTLPSVVKHISRMVEDKGVQASEIGELIARDQVLSAKILRLVNSPVYGFPGRISSVTHALVLLGFNVVKGLVLSTAVFDTFAQRTQGFSEHSLGCAIIARRLANELGMADVEEIMVAGLLHDLGKAVLSFLAPDEFERAVETAERDHCHIAIAERQVFGVDHAHVAGWVAREWHLPARLHDALARHHEPNCAEEGRQTTAVVHLADILARAMGYGAPGDQAMPPLDQDAFQHLAVSYEQIDRVLERAEMEFSAGADVFTTLE